MTYVSDDIILSPVLTVSRVSNNLAAGLRVVYKIERQTLQAEKPVAKA